MRYLPRSHCLRVLAFAIVAIAMMFLVGCFSVPRVETPIHDGAEGSIGLRVFSDSKFRARHPAQLKPVYVQRLLNGILVQEEKALIGSFLSRGDKPFRAFSDHEITFLLPHLSAAFAQATPEEQVFFKLTHVNSERTYYSEGTLHLSEQGVHFSLYSFHSPSRQVKMTERSSYGNTRPKRWSFQFSPPHPLSTRQKEPASQLIPGTLTIPLITLVNPPVKELEAKPSAEPTSSPQPEEPNRDLDALKQEVEELRRALKDQQHTLDQFEQERLRGPR